MFCCTLHVVFHVLCVFNGPRCAPHGGNLLQLSQYEQYCYASLRRTKPLVYYRYVRFLFGIEEYALFFKNRRRVLTENVLCKCSTRLPSQTSNEAAVELQFCTMSAGCMVDCLYCYFEGADKKAVLHKVELLVCSDHHSIFSHFVRTQTRFWGFFCECGFKRLGTVQQRGVMGDSASTSLAYNRDWKRNYCNVFFLQRLQLKSNTRGRLHFKYRSDHH